jgi:5,10-methenyltetrahydrofolate synthetase
MNPPSPDRTALRRQLLQARQTWIDSPAATLAQPRLAERALSILAQLEPDCLGIYWPMKGEFNPMDVARQARSRWACQLALPFAHKSPIAMDFRTWDGEATDTADDHGIPSSSGPICVPDVLLVPCVGFTAEGWRLGYGGGYFDRFMAAHPHVTAIGVAWELGRLDAGSLTPAAHDQALMAIVTESNIYGS